MRQPEYNILISAGVETFDSHHSLLHLPQLQSQTVLNPWDLEYFTKIPGRDHF